MPLEQKKKKRGGRKREKKKRGKEKGKSEDELLLGTGLEMLDEQPVFPVCNRLRSQENQDLRLEFRRDK